MNSDPVRPLHAAPLALSPLPQRLPTQALAQGFVIDAPAALPAAGSGSAGPKARADAATRQGIHVAGLKLMLRYEDGSELTELPGIYGLPNAPAWCLGMVNLHGALVPVFDLAAYLGLARDEAAKPMLLVLAHGSDAAGILIDGLPVRLKLDNPPPLDGRLVPDALQGCVKQACLIGEQAWIDLDCRALLAQLETGLAAH